MRELQTCISDASPCVSDEGPAPTLKRRGGSWANALVELNDGKLTKPRKGRWLAKLSEAEV